MLLLKKKKYAALAIKEKNGELKTVQETKVCMHAFSFGRSLLERCTPPPPPPPLYYYYYYLYYNNKLVRGGNIYFQKNLFYEIQMEGRMKLCIHFNTTLLCKTM